MLAVWFVSVCVPPRCVLVVPSSALVPLRSCRYRLVVSAEAARAAQHRNGRAGGRLQRRCTTGHKRSAQASHRTAISSAILHPAARSVRRRSTALLCSAAGRGENSGRPRVQSRSSLRPCVVWLHSMHSPRSRPSLLSIASRHQERRAPAKPPPMPASAHHWWLCPLSPLLRSKPRQTSEGIATRSRKRRGPDTRSRGLYFCRLSLPHSVSPSCFSPSYPLCCRTAFSASP